MLKLLFFRKSKPPIPIVPYKNPIDDYFLLDSAIHELRSAVLESGYRIVFRSKRLEYGTLRLEYPRSRSGAKFSANLIEFEIYDLDNQTIWFFACDEKKVDVRHGNKDSEAVYSFDEERMIKEIQNLLRASSIIDLLREKKYARFKERLLDLESLMSEMEWKFNYSYEKHYEKIKMKFRRQEGEL